MKSKQPPVFWRLLGTLRVPARMVMKKIRVLVVDDSPFLRRTLPKIMVTDPQIEVVGVAANGEEAIEMALSLRPDVITMDILMPVMDGMTALQEIMRQRPTPVLMLSSLTYEGAEKTLEALSLGAVDYIAKPSGPTSLDIQKVGRSIVDKIKAVRDCRVGVAARIGMPAQPPGEPPGQPQRRPKGMRKTLVALAASTGGPPALEWVLGGLPGNLHAGLVIVQHMSNGFTEALAQRLNRETALDVRVARQGEKVLPGTALVAPSGLQMEVKKHAGEIRIQLSEGPQENLHNPSADALFLAMAKELGPSACAVIMTGMGNDGARGMVELRKRGGLTIAQDEETSLIFGMPRVAIEKGGVDIVAPLEGISVEITKAVGAGTNGAGYRGFHRHPRES